MGLKHTKTEAPTCTLLSLAAEIRLEIYSHVVPQNFMPNTTHKDYEGLYLSCKQIKHELDYETLRAAPANIHDLIQSSACTELPPTLNVLPLGPLRMSSLLRVTIEIPRSTLDSRETEVEALRVILALLGLHLNSVTINIVETFNKTKQPKTLEPRRKSNRIAEKSSDTVEKWWNVREGNRYREETTFATVNGFVSAVNCLVAPVLCRHYQHKYHSRGNFFCVRPGQGRALPPLFPPQGQAQGQPSAPVIRPVLPSTTVNVRKIVVQIKELHKEGTCPFCDSLPHIHYQHDDDLARRWTPGKENTQLHLFGWHAEEMDKHGVVTDLVLDGHPAKFIWTQQPIPAKLKDAKASFLATCEDISP